MLLRTLAAAALLALAPLASQAATVLDTLDPATRSYFTLLASPTAAQSRLGQSVTFGTDVENVTVTAQFVNLNAGPVNVLAQLVAGAGVGGAVLGADTLTATAAEVAGRIPATRTADFSALGRVAAGTYTVVFSGTGALSGGAAGVDTDGTDSFGALGVFDFRSNLAREFGIVVTADPIAPVPLPAGAALLLTGLGTLAAARRRR